jgi:hypothetical protein
MTGLPVPRKCEAVDCDDAADAGLMCRRHWRLVPEALRAEVWRTHRGGQSIDTASVAYLLAAAKAIEHVADGERRDAGNRYRAAFEAALRSAAATLREEARR